jgi:20S proteasome alpha/beta subunit
VTLLVGILSTDGVVIATDRQVTHGTMGQATVAQSATKAEIINGQALYASAGPMAVGQQICAAMKVMQGQFGGKICSASVQLIQPAIRAILDPAFDTAKKAGQIMGPQLALVDVITTGLLAAKFQDGIRLLDISQQGSCEVLSVDKVPFVCHGSGKQNADPILRFLWNIYWSKQAPTHREAILAAYWTVKIAIELKSPMVGYAPDVFVLEKTGKDGKHVKARKVDENELVSHDEFILAVENAMRGVRDRLADGAAPATPVPPTVAADPGG